MGKKRLLFIISMPGQFYTWQYSIIDLLSKGNQVSILAREHEVTLVLLKNSGFEYRQFKLHGSGFRRIWGLANTVNQGLKLCRQFKPNMIIGFGISATLVSAVSGKPSIIFTDSEPVPFQNYINKIFAKAIITPSCFNISLGKKHIRIQSYKELAYLHPNRFTPDPAILNELKVNQGEKYVILRFNAFDAVHDIGRKGFSIEDKYQLVRKLEPYAHIFISSEIPLPADLQKYQLKIPVQRIHHVLYYAHMLVSDTGTMTTEAAILGTPGIMCLSNAGQFGNFIELEQKYDLIYSFGEAEQAIQKAVELIQQPDLKEQWALKRQKLVADKIDFTQLMVDFIEKYPESFDKYKR